MTDFWFYVGLSGGLIFYSRFYVQWLASERSGRSVIPVVFWYMSGIGSLMLLAYAFVSQSPLGALGQSMNVVVYSRNLVHIWREQGRLNPALNRTIHALVAVIAMITIGLMLWTWWREYEINSQKPASETQQAWLWLAIGIAGQALFAARFLIQWLATEKHRRSVVPNAFWHLSIVAATLQTVCFMQRMEWIFAVGMSATILIYARNLWFIHGTKESATTSGPVGFEDG